MLGLHTVDFPCYDFSFQMWKNYENFLRPEKENRLITFIAGTQQELNLVTLGLYLLEKSWTCNLMRHYEIKS